MILYHGSNIKIEKIDLGKCKPFKDFGCGFYTTLLRDQAVRMAERTVRIYREGKPCVTEFFSMTLISHLWHSILNSLRNRAMNGQNL